MNAPGKSNGGNGPSGNPSSVLAELVDRLTARLQTGEAIDWDEVLREHPEHAEELGLLRPALGALDELSRSDSAAASGIAAPEAGEPGLSGVVGDFRIVGELGRGGMGVVYEAEQISLGRRVALKVLPFAATLDPRHLQRFQNEARAAAHLHHTHIVPVFAVGCEHGVHFYAMQFIEGQTLANVIEQLRQNALPSPTPPTAPSAETTPQAGLATERSIRSVGYLRGVAKLGIQAAEALDHAHQQGVIHRDVKPGNLMVDVCGNLWIADFGLAQFQTDARLTMTGDLVGTLRYMSPEQALAKRGIVDHRTDVYSLGATLYELVTLRPVLAGNDRQELLRQIAFEEPRRPRGLNRAIPAELETIVLKALEKDPQNRYATAQELADDLRRWLDDRSILARRPSWMRLAARWARRHKTVVWTAAVFVALLVTGLVVGLAVIWQKEQKTAAALQATRVQRRQARRAVDKMYLEVADKWLDRQPQMSELQNQFLREVLHYYQSFAEEEGEDEETRFDRAKAYSRVGVILIFSFGGQQAGDARPYLLQANALLETLVRDFPNEPVYIYELARAKRNLGFTSPQGGEEEHRQSVILLEDLVARFPSEPEYRFSLAGSLVNLANPVSGAGRWTEAEGICRRALKVAEELARSPSPKPDYLTVFGVAAVNLAESLSLARRWDEAADSYRVAIAAYQRLAPDSSGLPEYQHGLVPFDWNNFGDFYRQFGGALRHIGLTEDAEEAFRQAIRIHQKLVADFPTTSHHSVALLRDYRDQGRLFWACGRLREAEHAYGQLVDVGKTDEAIAVLREALKLAPNDAVLHNTLAWLLATCPDPKFRNLHQAVLLAKRAVHLASQEGGFWNTLGVASYRAGDWQAAVDGLNKSMELSKGGDSSNWFFLAMANWRLDKKEQAQKTFLQAVAWMEKNKPQDKDLLRFREEAATLLKTENKPNDNPK